MHTEKQTQKNKHKIYIKYIQSVQVKIETDSDTVLAVGCHRECCMQSLQAVYKHSNPHTHTHMHINTYMHAKNSVGCFIHTADRNSLACSSVTLTQQEKSGEKYKAIDIEGKEVKHRNSGTENKREGTREAYSRVLQLKPSSAGVYTPDFLHFLPLFFFSV